MPLGQSGYGNYGYFDIPGAFSGYEDALMGFAGSQKTDFWDFLSGLGPILQQLMEQKRQREIQGQEQKLAGQRVDISQQYVDLARQTEGRQQTWDQYRMGQPPKQLIGETLWLTNHPGATHEDYLRATKGITAEFKEPKTPKGLQDKTQLLFKRAEERRKVIAEYYRDFLKDWAVYSTKEGRGKFGEALETPYPQKQTFWLEWQKRVPFEYKPEIEQAIFPSGGRMHMATPPGKPPEQPEGTLEYTQEQMDNYNACRDRGGTKEACKVEAGF